MKNIAVIVAAGNSTRCGFDKLFTGKFGKPLIEKNLSVFDLHEMIDEVVLVLSSANFGKGESLRQRFPKITKVLPGGENRYESVKMAFEYLHNAKDGNARVIVHNGANADLKHEDLSKGIEMAQEKKSVIFGYFSPNSIKKVIDGRVVSFLDRDEIFETQTPQISDLSTFVKAIERVEFSDSSLGMKKVLPRDEAELLNAIGEDISVYECCSSNRKVTYASDFVVGMDSEKMEKPNHDFGDIDVNFRVGVGEDSHRFADEFDPQNPITIGGVRFPESEKTFEANSDGDVILHSLCNAILSSIGEKTFDEFATPMCQKGITNSEKYLEKTMEIVREKRPKFEIINIVFSLEGKFPKLAPRHDELILGLKDILKISDKKIGLTYTSGEELSSFGRGEGVYCLCNILVRIK